MKKNKTYLFAGAFVVIGIGAYLIYKFVTKSKPIGISTSEESPSQPKSTSTTLSSSSLPSASFPLKNGSKGKEVKVLQKWLNDKGYSSPKLVEDGIFGAKTESVVKSMQMGAFEKSISDYLADSSFSGNYKSGQITKDFYDIFITKTKEIKKETNPFGVNINPFG